MPMTPAQVLEIFNNVKQNHKRLEECTKPHDFQPITGARKYKCTKCNGEIDTTHYYWYYQGLCDRHKQDLEKEINSIGQI